MFNRKCIQSMYIYFPYIPYFLSLSSGMTLLNIYMSVISSIFFAFYLKIIGNNFVKNIVLKIFYAILLYLTFFAFIIEYFDCKMYSEHLCMEFIARRVSDLFQIYGE